MTVYLLKSVFCAFFFLIVYHFLMEKDKMLKFKRFYLLGTLLFSLIIPIVSIPLFTESFSPIEEVTSTYAISFSGHDAGTADAQQQPVRNAFSWMYALTGIYSLVVSIFLGRFLHNLFQIIRYGKKGHAIKKGKVKILREDNLDTSFSFFNHIFISKNDYENNNIRNEILIHELVHVKQKHSADVMLIELLIIFFWFNPTLYLYRRAIKLNHEFLADEGVINSTGDIPAYQSLLINRATTPYAGSLTSNLTYLITKKRLIMMAKTTSKRKFLLKMIVLIPAFLIAGGIFSTRITASTSLDVPIGAILHNRATVTVDDSIIKPESGISENEMNEYSKIVSKYLDEVHDGKITWKSKEISEEDRLALYPLFIRMTKEQRKKHLIKFLSVLTPMKLRSPNVDEWRACLNRDKIWIDGKIVNHEEAKAYNRRSMVFFIYSKKPGETYMWTKKGYEEYINKYGEQILLPDLLKIPAHTLFSIGYKDPIKAVKNGRFELANAKPE